MTKVIDLKKGKGSWEVTLKDDIEDAEFTDISSEEKIVDILKACSRKRKNFLLHAYNKWDWRSPKGHKKLKEDDFNDLAHMLKHDVYILQRDYAIWRVLPSNRKKAFKEVYNFIYGYKCLLDDTGYPIVSFK